MYAFFIDFYVVVSDVDYNPRFPIGALECQSRTPTDLGRQFNHMLDWISIIFI